MSENFQKYEYSGLGLSTQERHVGEKLFEQYRIAYPRLRKLNDLKLLEELVFHEVIGERYKQKIAKIAKKSKNSNKDENELVSESLQKRMKQNLNTILELQEKLGMNQDKDSVDSFNDIEDLFEKFALWRKENQGSRKVTCPFCSKIFFLMIRTDKYEEKKFPFFQDKLLCNPEIHNWWREGRITDDEYARALGSSPDFPQWLDENWFQKLPENQISQSSTEESGTE